MNIFHKKSGLTLIEMLIVIAIIGILASVVSVSLNSARLEARDAQRKNDLNQIRDALELYYNDHRGYPIPLNRQGRSFDANSYDYNGVAHDWPNWFKTALVGGGYIQKLPIDPTNSNQYMYSYGVTRTSDRDTSEYGRNYYLTVTLENQKDSSMVAFSTFKVKITNVTPSSGWCDCRSGFYNKDIKGVNIGPCGRNVYILSSSNWDDANSCAQNLTN